RSFLAAEGLLRQALSRMGQSGSPHGSAYNSPNPTPARFPRVDFMRTLPFLIALIIALGFVPASGAQDKPAHVVVRVTEPEAPRPVEVSAAINPTNPDFIIGVSQQGPTNVAYVTKDAGRTWKTVPTANPAKRIQG